LTIPLLKLGTKTRSFVGIDTKNDTMMKYTSGLLFLFIVWTSCGQNLSNSEAQLKEADTAKVPMSMVRNVRQARNGDILIASYLGVFRYDGTSFTNLTSKIISARFASFWDVLEDRKGNLWFASKDSGVYWFGTTVNTFIYDGKTFSLFTDNGKPFKNVFNIIEDRKGNIWLGGTRYDGNTFTNLTNSSILCLYEDRNGNIWTTSSISPSEKNWVLSRYEGNSIDNQEPTVTIIKPELGPLFTILESYDGSIWLGSDGAYRYDGQTFHDFKSKVLQK
jgi:ligand-binding sensor domain-containing protein